MKIARIPASIVRRIGFLWAGNAVLLIVIWLFLKQGGSFLLVLAQAGPDLAPVLLAGLGLTGIVFTGAIDLSIGSIVAVSGTVFGILVHYQEAPWIAFLGCVASAWLLSVLNSVVVRFSGIPAIVVTLAALPFYRGLALILADLSVPAFSGNFSVQNEAYHTPGKVDAGWILVGVIGITLGWEAFARTPRRWLALGSSPEAAHQLGFNPGTVLVEAFFAGGLLLGLASLLYVTRIQAIEPSRIALGFELQVIGAVVLGGTNIFGGEGTYLGTVLGGFFLYFLSQVLTYAGASPYCQDAIAGAVIVLVIGTDCALHRRHKLMEELA
jgi:ribose/xylose/arabinose/galactoside ABC-type transport system permease subunit